MSDGASISYDSRGWARTICQQFVVSQYLNPDWLNQARIRFQSNSALPVDDWAAVHAFDRGSYATFLGLTISNEALVVYAIGDTVLFVLAPDGQVTMLPKIKASDFGNDPVLLCSRSDRGAFADTDEAFENAKRTKKVPSGGWGGTRLIALTDALAEWVVGSEDAAEQMKRLNEIDGHRSQGSFAVWAGGIIAAGDVRRDDCAALMISL